MSILGSLKTAFQPSITTLFKHEEMELTNIKTDEIDAVSGALFQGTAIGAGVYLLGSAFNGSFSWGGLATGGFSALAGGARALGTVGRGVVAVNGAALGGTTQQIIDSRMTKAK